MLYRLNNLLPFLFVTLSFAQKPEPPEPMVCKYAWIFFFNQDKAYNSVCCVSDGFTANTCTVYACPGETIYFSGQVDAPTCASPTAYNAVWNFGTLAPSVTDSNVYYAPYCNVYDSMTPLHAVTIPANTSPGSVFPIFFSYCFNCGSSPQICDTTSIITLNVLPDSLFQLSVLPDTACTNELVTVSYYSEVPGQNALPIADYDFGDGNGVSSLNTNYYSNDDEYLITVRQIGAFCYHHQTDTVLIEDCVGMEEVKLNKFSVFPNPSASWITIKSDDEAERILITDLFGNIVIVCKKKEINVSKLPGGIYYLFYECKNETFSTRFVKM